MKLAALALSLVCVVASAECRTDRRDRRVNRLRGDCGVDSLPAASLLFAQSDGVGMGAECACASVTTPDGGSVSFERTVAAFCIKQDFTHVQCAAGFPRVMSGRTDDSWLGVASETQRQNLLAVNSARDLSDAAWVKTTMTCTKTATGVTGVSNSASTCTASAGNATVVQSTVLSLAPYAVSVHIRRRTGTGTVSVSSDGSTWFDITNWVSSSWKRVVPYETIGCAGGRCIDVPEFGGNATNPIVAIKLATNGDSVDVDLAQVEQGTYATTPIDINGTNLGYRTRDRIALPIIYSTARGYSAGLTSNVQGNQSSNSLLEIQSGPSSFATGYNSGSTLSCNYIATGAGPTASKTGGHFYRSGEHVACSWDGVATVTAYFDGGSGSATTAAAAFTTTALTLGGSDINGSSSDSVVRNACFATSQSACTAPDPVVATKRLAYIGDSISVGITGTGPDMTIKNFLGPSWTVVPGAVGGATAADCLTNFNNVMADGGITHLTMMCGINDAIHGGTEAVAWPSLQTILNTARTAGVLVYPQYILGCDGGSGCDATAVAQIALLNTDLTNWCADAGVTCIDGRPILSPGGTISPLYNYGDAIHLNENGSIWLTSIVRLGLPP